MKKNLKNIGNKIKKDEFYIHPNTLNIIKNNEKNDICPTKYYIYNNNKLNTTTKINCKQKNNNEISKFMLYPSTIINYNEILNIYDIVSFDDLFNNIKNLIQDNKTFETINRILNCWIKNNFDDLKKKNNILINIYLYIFNKYYPKINIKELYLTNEINKWFNSQKKYDFNINLGDEIIKNLDLNI